MNNNGKIVDESVSASEQSVSLRKRKRKFSRSNSSKKSRSKSKNNDMRIEIFKTDDNKLVIKKDVTKKLKRNKQESSDILEFRDSE